MEWDRTEEFNQKRVAEMDALTKEVLIVLAIEHYMVYESVPAFTILKNYMDRYYRALPYKDFGYVQLRDFLKDIPVINEDTLRRNHYRLSKNYWNNMGKYILPKRKEKENYDENVKKVNEGLEKLVEWDKEEWAKWGTLTKPSTPFKVDSPLLEKVSEWLEKNPLDTKSSPTKSCTSEQPSGSTKAPDDDDNWTVVSSTKDAPSHSSTTSPFSHISKKSGRNSVPVEIVKPKINKLW